MTIMPRNKQQFRQPRPVVDNTEIESVWNSGTTNTSMEEESPPLFSSTNRTDTINSSTQFFSLTDVQPQNPERYSGISLNATDEDLIDLPESRGGIKRQHDGSLNSSCISQSRVIVVQSADQQVYTDNIPLGGSANSLPRLEPYHDPLTSVYQASPTTNIPSFQFYAGPHGFNATFTKLSESSKNRHWDFSSMLEKLYIDMNKWVQVEFHVGPNPLSGLSIRVLPVFSDANYINEPVKRCPNHAIDTDPTNENFTENKHHLIRVVGDDVIYLEDPNTHRLSVAFPVLAPAAGSEVFSKQIKFMCLGSDVGGINRRPTKVIFTLEDSEGEVLGRKVFDVRLCSCPRRDKQQEEERHLKQENQAKSIANKFANTVVVKKQDPDGANPPPGKKRLKLIDTTKYLMIPIRVEDFKTMDDFAEKLAISREIQDHPTIPHAQVIQETKTERIKLEREHNQEIVSYITQKKKK